MGKTLCVCQISQLKYLFLWCFECKDVHVTSTLNDLFFVQLSGGTLKTFSFQKNYFIKSEDRYKSNPADQVTYWLICSETQRQGDLCVCPWRHMCNVQHPQLWCCWWSENRTRPVSAWQLGVNSGRPSLSGPQSVSLCLCLLCKTSQLYGRNEDGNYHKTK